MKGHLLSPQNFKPPDLVFRTHGFICYGKSYENCFALTETVTPLGFVIICGIFNGAFCISDYTT